MTCNGASGATGLAWNSQNDDGQDEEYDEQDGDDGGNHHPWHTAGTRRCAWQRGGRGNPGRDRGSDDGRRVVMCATLFRHFHQLLSRLAHILPEQCAANVDVIEDVIQAIATK